MRSFNSIVAVAASVAVLIQIGLGAPILLAKRTANQTPAFDAVRVNDAADTAAVADWPTGAGRRTTIPLPPLVPELEVLARRIADSNAGDEADAKAVWVPDWDNKKRSEKGPWHFKEDPKDTEKRKEQRDCITRIIKRYFVNLIKEEEPSPEQAGSVFKIFNIRSRKSWCASCVLRKAEIDLNRKPRGFITVDKRSGGVAEDSVAEKESTSWDNKARKPRGFITVDGGSGSDVEESTTWDDKLRKSRGHIAADRSNWGVSWNFDNTEDMERANKDKRESSAVSNTDLEPAWHQVKPRGFITVDRALKAEAISSPDDNFMDKRHQRRGEINGGKKGLLAKEGNVDVQTA